jgi:predicted MFS family arabinose efflux permease
MLVFLGGAPLGAPLAGWVAEAFGARLSIVAGGVISIAATVVMTFLLARSRGVQVRAYLRRAELTRNSA